MMVRRGLASSAPAVHGIGLGLAMALLVALIAGCETLSLDEPAAADAVVAARAEEPAVDAEAEPVAPPRPTRDVEDLTRPDDGTAGLSTS